MKCGGVPASFIMTIDDYAQKLLSINKSYPWINDGKMIVDVNSKEMIKLRQDYFFGNRF